MAAVDADAHKELGGRFGIQGGRKGCAFCREYNAVGLYPSHARGAIHTTCWVTSVSCRSQCKCCHICFRTGFPTIKILYLKNGKLVSSDYNGGRTAADIVKAALAEASKIALGRIGAKASGGGGGGRASGSRLIEINSRHSCQPTIPLAPLLANPGRIRNKGQDEDRSNITYRS